MESIKHVPPIQRAMLDLLGDGRPHTAAELRECLYDPMGAMNNIHHHLTAIRKLIRPAKDVASVRYGGVTQFVIVTLDRQRPGQRTP